MKKIYLLNLLVILVFSFNIKAQNVYIPDANFRLYLNTEFPSYMDADGESLNTDSAATYTGAITCINKNIYDLSGIEHFVQLDELNCSFNFIAELNINNLLNLTKLNCSVNYNLTTLNLNNLQNLEILNCSSNNLTTLDLNNQVNLTNLNYHSNNISTFDFSNLSNLTDLNCYNNDIPSLDISNLTNLIVLKCNLNDLTSLDLSNQSNLTELNYNSNMIQDLDFSNLTNLTILNCGSNQLWYLDNIGGLVNLVKLDCGYNGIDSIDVSNMPNLTSLLCHSNNITNLDLSNSDNLTTLTCSSNDITYLDINNLVNLIELGIGHNPISNIDLTSQTELLYFSCIYSNLESLDVSNQPNLINFDCYNCSLTSIDVSNNPDIGRFSCNNNLLTELDISNNPNIHYFRCHFNQLMSLNAKSGNNQEINTFEATNNPYLFCIEVDDVEWSNDNWNNIDSNSFFSENCSVMNTITGTIFNDDNCVINGTEQVQSQIIVKTEPFTHYGITDSLGNYVIYTLSGAYQVNQIITHPLVNPLCPSPNYHTVYFDSLAQDTTGLNFYNEIIECPLLTVSISSDRRRRCFSNNTYVEYCNDGFADETSVEVVVQFPEYVIFQSADYAFTINDEDQYVFNIGELAQGECGTIHIIDSVACIEDITGLTQCTEAFIFPPNTCLEALDTASNLAWDNSSIEVSGACQNDTLVQFVISNTGEWSDGDMMNAHEYRIYVDNALAVTNTFQLNGGESITIDYLANGQTIRLEADQHPNHPGNSQPQEIIEACGNQDDEVSMGFVNSITQDDADYDLDIDCLPIIDSYDPNDKSVSPDGISSNHYLEAGTLLDYQIRFQNTGSDTAYTVVIVDTLSVHLDPSSIQWGLSSHPYTVDVTGMGTPILSFSFNDIDLPDSTTNELASHGFIKYKVAAYDSLANGTEINNTAYIYFDYNTPIMTNTAQIIVSDTVLINQSTKVEILRNEDFRIYPNPTTGKFTVDAETFDKIEIYNVSGILVKSTTQKEIDLSAQAKGLYFVKVVTLNGTQTKKIILE